MEIGSQMAAFALIMSAGLLLGLLLDSYRIARSVFKPNIWVTSLGDVLYWLTAIPIVFGALLAGNWGELRWYVFVALLTGTILYYRLLSRFSVRLIRVALLSLVAAEQWLATLVYHIVLRPIWLLGKTVTFPFRFLAGQLERAWRQTGVWCRDKKNFRK